MRRDRRTVALTLMGTWMFGFFLSSLRVFIAVGEWPYLSWHMTALEEGDFWLPAGFAMCVDAIVKFVSGNEGFEFISDYRLLTPYLFVYWVVLILLHVQAIRKSSWRYAVLAIGIILVSSYNWHALPAMQ